MASHMVVEFRHMFRLASLPANDPNKLGIDLVSSLQTGGLLWLAGKVCLTLDFSETACLLRVGSNVGGRIGRLELRNST